MTAVKTKRPLIQWLVLVFLIGVIGAGMWFARNDPDTDWGPIVLGAMALIGLIVRSLFNTPENADGDGYESH
jgi:hypothetical protein